LLETRCSSARCYCLGRGKIWDSYNNISVACRFLSGSFDPSRDPTLDLHEWNSRRPQIDLYIITVIIV